MSRERETDDLAALDVLMPGMSGPELFGCLQGLHPNLEVLFMSGYKPERIAQFMPE